MQVAVVVEQIHLLVLVDMVAAVQVLLYLVQTQEQPTQAAVQVVTITVLPQRAVLAFSLSDT